MVKPNDRAGGVLAKYRDNRDTYLVPSAQRGNRSHIIRVDGPSPANEDACVHCNAFMAYLKSCVVVRRLIGFDTTDAVPCGWNVRESRLHDKS